MSKVEEQVNRIITDYPKKELNELYAVLESALQSSSLEAWAEEINEAEGKLTKSTKPGEANETT